MSFFADPPQDPYLIFKAWFEDARASEINDANAMVLSTRDEDQPLRLSSRAVLMQSYDERGFVFYTNLLSRKGQALQANPQAALLFYWKSLRRQVRIEGAAERVDDAMADAYFASRPRGSQLGAWASEQSAPLAERALLEARLAEYEARFAEQTVQRPPFWGGFCVKPDMFEFWQDMPSRLHQRLEYQKELDHSWSHCLLNP